jgi:nitrate/nitrite transport system ATP-binding protein
LPFVEARNVAKLFRSGGSVREVLKGVNLSVEEGEFVSIVGSTGSGKSTLLSILAGLTMPDEGSVSIQGEKVQGIHPRASFVFQNYSLLPWFSAVENVRLGVQAAFPEWDRSRQLAHARKFLEMVGLGAALQKRPSQLSGGMRQRVAIARAFATEPAILFLDEPFSALDALTRATLQQELIRLCSNATHAVTAIMITNNLDEALLVSDRIVPMTRGPRAKLGLPIPVNLPRPRSEAMLAHDPVAARTRAEVVERLAEFVHGRRGAAAAQSQVAHTSAAVAEEQL